MLRLTLTRLVVLGSITLCAQAVAAPAAAPRFDVTDDATYERLLDAGVAAEIIRHELAIESRPRLAASLTLLAAFAERNPSATPEQLGVFAAEIDGVLMGVFPADPELSRTPHLLPAIRFASRDVSAPELVGTDLTVGRDALELIELAPEMSARSIRSADFERAQGVDFSNHSPFANLVIAMMLDRTPSGRTHDGLASAADALAALNGIDLAPADLASSYPDIAQGLGAVPANFAAYQAEQNTSFAGLQTAVDAEFDVLRTRIDSSLVGIADALAREPDQYEAAKNAKDPVLIEQLRQQQLDALRERTASRTTLALNTLLIAQAEDESAREFSRQARDFSDIQLETNQTLDNVQAGLEVGGNLFTAVGNFKTGNPFGGIGSLLTAVGGILGIVGDNDDTPSAEQQIFDQIVELRQQVEDLRVEMNARFDSIDRQLDIIYQAMSSGLNQINETTRRIDGNVQQISLDLYELRSALTSLEANLYGVLSAGFEQSFVEDMETGLAYRQRTGTDLIYTGQGDNTFFAFHSRFYARATTIATDEVYAGTSNVTLINDGAAAEQLTSFPLGYNINNLRQFPTQLGLPVLGFGRVANPTTWSLAADAYAQLARENPWYFAKLNQNDPGRLDQVIATGESVRGMMRNARDRDLIEALITQYQNRIAALDAAIGVPSWLTSNGYSGGLDLWGGFDQDMRGKGRPITSIRYYDGDSFGDYTPWFDPALVWELFDSRIGLAVATNLPGYPLSRYDFLLNNGITEDVFPNPTHRMGITLRDLTGGSNRLYYEVEYGWGDGIEPPEFYEFFNTRGEAIEFILRAEAGDQMTFDGYTIWIDNIVQTIGFDATPPPAAGTINNRLNEIADDYWTDTNNELSSSPTLELIDSITSTQKLLEAYITLGMPESMESNDLIRAATRGAASEQSGLGGEWISDAFYAAIPLEIYPPRLDELAERGDLLLEQLDPALDAPAHEAHPYIEWSLKSLYDLDDNALDLCVDDTYTVAPGSTLTVDIANGVLANDAQQPGATINAASIFPTTYGSLSLAGDGSFTYMPNPGFEGIDTFLYVATANVAPPGETPNLVSANPATVVIRVDASAEGCVADVTSQNAPEGSPNFGVPDGAVTAADLQFFVNAWFVSDTAIADVTSQNAPEGSPNYGVPDGAVTAADLNFFVNAWIAGCP